MDDQLHQIKQGKVLRALQLIENGTTKKAACEEVGISTWLFRQALKDDPSLSAAIIAQRNRNLQEDYDEVSETHRDILRKLLAWAKKESLSTKDIAFLESRLAQIEDRLALQLGGSGQILPEDNTAAAYLRQLTGPILRPGRAVITKHESTTTVEIHSDEPGETIEGNFVALPPENKD